MIESAPVSFLVEVLLRLDQLGKNLRKQIFPIALSLNSLTESEGKTLIYRRNALPTVEKCNGIIIRFQSIVCVIA